jgi:hypothetical protein
MSKFLKMMLVDRQKARETIHSRMTMHGNIIVFLPHRVQLLHVPVGKLQKPRAMRNFSRWINS